MGERFTFETVRGSALDVVRAVGVRRRFRRHLHRRGVVCRIDAGVRRFSLGGAEELAAAGDLVVIPAGVPHACEPVDGAPHAYRVISCPGPFPAAPAVVRDAGARRAFDRAFLRLLRGDGRGAEALVQLLMTHGQRLPPFAPRERARVARIRDRIEARPGERLPLRALAAEVRMSPFTLSRAFRDRYGLPPLEYQHLVRVQRAQDLLRAGERSLAAVAQELGFADQAHLTRVFKRFVGVPPGRWTIALAEATSANR